MSNGSERINPGDVTGPRWVGGVNAPAPGGANVRQARDEAFSAWLSTPRGPKPGDGSSVDYGFNEGFRVGAEWARKEALREAAQAALSTPLTLNDIGYEAEEIADAIRALAERGSLMDSSNAEKAWEAREGLFTGAPQEARAFIAADKAGFMAGRASRDAEVAELLAQAWAEGFKQGGPMHDEDASDPDAHTRNPYRSKK